eukprot:gene36501-45014_t
MIAIDDMTIENGCLQVSKGSWSEENSVLCEEISTGNGSENPDGNGRRGAIQSEAAAGYLTDPLATRHNSLEGQFS